MDSRSYGKWYLSKPDGDFYLNRAVVQLRYKMIGMTTRSIDSHQWQQ